MDVLKVLLIYCDIAQVAEDQTENSALFCFFAVYLSVCYSHAISSIHENTNMAISSKALPPMSVFQGNCKIDH